MNNDSIILKFRDLPNEILENDLGLSYRGIARRCHLLSKKYSDDITSANLGRGDVVSNQQKLRRNLSNWVNDPKNLVNSKGKYIGDKFGARITVCMSSGVVIHDVETFCRDVNNKNNRILGKNNNFIFIKNEYSDLNNENSDYVFSTLNVDAIENSNIQYRTLKAYKVKSSSLPSSDPTSTMIKYSPNDTTSDDNVTIVAGHKLDLRTTRKEVIQATCGKYGYDSRISSTNHPTHYVCKKVKGKDDRTFFIRLSYFQFPPATILDVAAQSGNFTTLITALKATGLDKNLSTPGPYTILAPTDAAFAKLPAGTVEALLENLPTLTNILKYHVVAGKKVAADVAKLTTLPTLFEGKNVTISVQNGKAFINNAQVTVTDILVSNSVIHVIDAVLLPPS
jgi:hypothetical protein